MSEKLREQFDEMVVYKDLKEMSFLKTLKLPSFLRDWVLKKFQDEEGNFDTDELLDFVSTYMPRKEEWNSIKNRIITGYEHVKLLSLLGTTMWLSNLKIPYTLNGDGARFAGINSVSFDNKNGESILHLLDLKGICVSTGSACDSVNTQISHVLRSIGLSDSLSLGTIRVSFGKENTIDDAITIANAINQIITK